MKYSVKQYNETLEGLMDPDVPVEHLEQWLYDYDQLAQQKQEGKLGELWSLLGPATAPLEIFVQTNFRRGYLTFARFFWWIVFPIWYVTSSQLDFLVRPFAVLGFLVGFVLICQKVRDRYPSQMMTPGKHGDPILWWLGVGSTKNDLGRYRAAPYFFMQLIVNPILLFGLAHLIIWYDGGVAAGGDWQRPWTLPLRLPEARPEYRILKIVAGVIVFKWWIISLFTLMAFGTNIAKGLPLRRESTPGVHFADEARMMVSQAIAAKQQAERHEDVLRKRNAVPSSSESRKPAGDVYESVRGGGREDRSEEKKLAKQLSKHVKPSPSSQPLQKPDAVEHAEPDPPTRKGLSDEEIHDTLPDELRELLDDEDD